MVISKSRFQAIKVARNFALTASLASGKSVDFYMLLWVVHWAIENFGLEKTEQTLSEIMVETDFDPENAPAMLRDRLFTNRVEEGVLQDWFERALNN